MYFMISLNIIRSQNILNHKYLYTIKDLCIKSDLLCLTYLYPMFSSAV